MAGDPRLPFRRRRALRASLDFQHPPDCAPVHPQLPRDRLDAGSLSVKRAHLLVPGFPPLVPKLDLGRALGNWEARAEFFAGTCSFVDAADRLAQAGCWKG